MRTTRILAATVLVYLGFISNSQAQITITSADMPNTGDTLRVSLASVQTALDLSLTGPSYTWNYGFLQPVSQDVDSFLSVSSTGTIYSFYYINSPLNSNRASIAQRGLNVAAFGGGAGLPVSDAYGFFYETTANFKQVGLGVSLSGVQTPIAYTNKDVIYNFPLTFGDSDTSESDYTFSIPGQVYLAGDQRRETVVDGWGTLTTPYGTFNTIRVKSTLTGQDSAYLDTLGSGFSFVRPLTREYKWLAVGQRIPVLQVNTSDVSGSETITAIRYRDSLRVSVGLSSPDQPVQGLQIFPNPGNGRDMKLVATIPAQGIYNLAVIDLSGRTFAESSLLLRQGQNLINLDELTRSLQAGVYLLTLQKDGSGLNVRFVLTR